MQKLLFAFIGLLIIGEISFLFSRKFYQTRYQAQKIFDAILPYDDLLNHAATIARSHSVTPKSDSAGVLFDRLDANYNYITMVHKELIDKVSTDVKMPSAAEWLLDNYYIIEQHIKQIQQNDGKKFLKNLPVIADGEYKGLPRVYAIATELVAHTDAKIDKQTIVGFVKRYQSEQGLSSIELWSLPVMLRMILVENIAYICRKIRLSRKEYEHADRYFKYISLKKDDPQSIKEKIDRYFSHNSRISESFIEQLLTSLKRLGKCSAYSLSLIDAHLFDKAFTTHGLVALEHKKQAARQISMGNSIVSMITISGIDWSEVFTNISKIEEFLLKDPAEAYEKMDAESKEYYRQNIKKLSEKLRISESALVSKALDKALCADEKDLRKRHIGYYIVGEGVDELAEKIRGERNFWIRYKPYSAKLYILSIVFLTLVLSGVLFLVLKHYAQMGVALILSLISLIPASDIGLKLFNNRLCACQCAKMLPRLDYEGGIPKEMSSFVIIPTLLFNKKNAEELVGNLEVHYLANRQDHIYFAILADFKDADYRISPDELETMEYAARAVRQLNATYSDQADRFFLFGRERTLNEGQSRWMGHERKRGAICEFVRFLKTGEKGKFYIIEGNTEELPTIKYVITLDSDTKLYKSVASQLIGAMSHPLNRAVVDEVKGVVVQGHGLMQPRVGTDIESANKTLFSKIFAGQGGIDQYSGAISDIYQDLFGEGIFTGKGIFDTDAFYATLPAAIPENTVLSHDLIEGCYLRCGLAGDVEVSDGYPAAYLSHMSRLHRWTRGDWQLIGWLKKMVINAQGTMVKNPLNAISRWKIADNLRRTLVSVMLAVLVFLGVCIFEDTWVVTIVFAAVVLGVSLITATINVVSCANFSFVSRRSNATVIYGVKGALLEVITLLFTLPYNAYLMADAILRTLWRVQVSHKNMLEWVTAADTESRHKGGLTEHYKKMWPSVAFGCLFVIFGIIRAALALHWLTPMLLGLLWIFTPVYIWFISRPYEELHKQETAKEPYNLRKLARLTWRYFEEFAGPSENFLPPDNVQLDPPNGVAHRTSPTNVGMLLMALLSARDFGYITTSKMIEGILNVMGTIDKLAKWRGHLFNWYDTKTLEILPPAYVSTVDSGNYIGYVMTLRQGLTEIKGKSLVDGELVLGLLDTIDLAKAEKPALEMADQALRVIPTLDGASDEVILHGIEAFLKSDFENGGVWAKKAQHMAQSILDEIQLEEEEKEKLKQQLDELIDKLGEIIKSTEFLPLFDRDRQLFSIGYNVSEEQLTKSYYDLMASEARQTSFIAIAKSEISHKHWFKLGRSLTSSDGYRGLVSWSGTMFEYLMPLLIMKNVDNTLMSESYWFALREQIKYGRKNGAPWGVSESAFFSFDLNLNYQYKAFGVPVLGMKRGLINDVVIAPYATVMALMVDKGLAGENIRRLCEAGMEGPYGLYEAADYTKVRLSKDEKNVIIKSYMVHHQGMSLMALDNVINKNIMQKRFSKDPMVRSVGYLLCERVHTSAIITNATKHESQTAIKPAKRQYYSSVRIFEKINTPLPAVHLLSNGSYHMMINDKGQGYSRQGDMNVTRWIQDDNQPDYGSYVYMTNITNGGTWGSTYAPFGNGSERYKIVFSPDKAEFWRSDGQLDTRTEIIVSAEDNAEIRRVSVTNHDEQEKIFEFTSYQEITLAPQNDDEAHRAFSNLFVRTEYIERYNALLASRRPRTEKSKPVWAMHLAIVDGEQIGVTTYETDRLKFIGRNNTLASPVALLDGQPISNSVGAVLDPIFSIKCRVKIPAGATVRVSYITGVAPTHEEIYALCSKYYSLPAIGSAFDLAQTRAQMESRYLGLGEGDEEEFLALLSHLIYKSPSKEQYADIISENRLGQQSLWQQGISGDLPVMLLFISETEDIGTVVRVLKCHEYLRLKGLKSDLVIVCREEGGYNQTLFEQVSETVSISHAREMQNCMGGVFVRSLKNMPSEFEQLLIKISKVVLDAHNMHLSAQVELLQPPRIMGIQSIAMSRGSDINLPPDLDYNNGYGGFDSENNEYVICIRDQQKTPLPWSNVIANPRFGTLVTESGGGYTWCENSRENKLSPWSNDPVCDPAGEACYIKDLDTGEAFSTAPISGYQSGGYLVRHGMGYSVFEHHCAGLSVTQTITVPPDDRVKLVIVHLKNTTEKRRVAVTYGFKPVLGVSGSAAYIATRYDGKVLYVNNTYNMDFTNMTAFLTCSGENISITGDAVGFEQQPGRFPAALGADSLNGKTGAGFDAYAAIQTQLTIESDCEADLVFVLGEGETPEEMAGLIQKYANPNAAYEALEQTKAYWRQITGAVQVKTPDCSMDIMLNGWLLYQTLACRIFARTAFYQCGGAYGFRDQLQDVMALLHTAPQLARKQILLHAAHQFEEGDVQHWWHEEYGSVGADRGVRTKFSDDLLWLVYVTCEYIEKTGDYGILEESCPYLKDELLTEHDERYGIPQISELSETLYQHCIRALDRGLAFGDHGLAFMGSGDWNDGMNTVGNKGKGESVWLSWFICDILQKFKPLCEYKQDEAQANRCSEVREELAAKLDKNAWDGHWYLRAFFDDGKPLGSAQNTECSIDAIAQAWSVISGAGQPDKAKEAMESAERYLVRRENAMITLLTPAFDGGELKPGYIKGYLPGIRENGGQYTHATAWVVMALARLGQGDRAWEYFNMLNPINHARTAMESMHYKTEPYVIAADVYSNPQHMGRGGWTWYTGAAGWFYKVAAEEILGIKLEADHLRLCPCIPSGWDGFEVNYRYKSAVYHISVLNPQHVTKEVLEVEVDGSKHEDQMIPLLDDKGQHIVRVTMGSSQ